MVGSPSPRWTLLLLGLAFVSTGGCFGTPIEEESEGDATTEPATTTAPLVPDLPEGDAATAAIDSYQDGVADAVAAGDMPEVNPFSYRNPLR